MTGQTMKTANTIMNGSTKSSPEVSPGRWRRCRGRTWLVGWVGQGLSGWL